MFQINAKCRQKLKASISCMVLAGAVSASGLAQANIVWGGDGDGPVLGYDATIGGAGPGTLTVRTDGGTIVLPNFNLPGDPLYKPAGGPSQYRFSLTGPDGVGVGGPGAVRDGAYAFINGTGDYDISIVYTYSGDHGPAEVIPIHIGTTGTLTDTGFLFTSGILLQNFFDPEETGRWTFTETWVNTTNPLDFITFDRPFCVGDEATCPALPSAVPEPISLALLGIGLAGLGFSRRKRS